MLALFCIKFVCILAISNPVYRWDSCKGSEWESVKKFLRLCNESRTHNWISRVACTCKPPNVEHVPSMPEVEASYQLEHYRAKSTDWPFSYLVAGTRDLVKLPASIVLKNLTLCISFLLQYKYPLYPQNVESFQREYWERNPKEKQDWLIHNLHTETFQSPLFSSSPLLHSWEVHYQNISHHTHICEKAIWCLGSS